METDDLTDKWGLESISNFTICFPNQFFWHAGICNKSDSSVYVVTEFLYEILAD